MHVEQVPSLTTLLGEYLDQVRNRKESEIHFWAVDDSDSRCENSLGHNETIDNLIISRCFVARQEIRRTLVLSVPAIQS